LESIDLSDPECQALVLAPTRELAEQVSKKKLTDERVIDEAQLFPLTEVS